MASLTRLLIIFLLVLDFLLTNSCTILFHNNTLANREKPVTQKIIALLTDYGNKDFYVGAMKGVIYSIYPEAIVVDITHQVTPYDIREGALILFRTEKEFPTGTIFVAVIDPGVGTSRKPIVLLTLDGKYFVGPDNGIFNFVLQEAGVQKIYQIENPKWMRQAGVSKTFHGRDIFVPVAAHLAAGWPVEEVGPEIKDYLLLSSFPAVRDGNRIKGEVTAIDHFGNVSLNIPVRLFKELDLKRGAELVVHLKEKKVRMKWVTTYGDLPEGKGMLLISSTGFLEIAVNRERAAGKYDIEIGDPLILEKLK